MRQYTEEELRAEFEKNNSTYHLNKESFGRRIVYQNVYVENEWKAWLKCARFLGVLAEAKEVNNAPK